jgi:hypothetical protein
MHGLLKIDKAIKRSAKRSLYVDKWLLSRDPQNTFVNKLFFL